MVSELVTLQSEAWPDGASRTVWRRNASGRFELESIDGQPPHPGWAKAELNTALGCPQSVDAEDGGSQSEPAFFPPSFVHSPATGKKLERPQTSDARTWLPPHGNQDLDKGLLRGGKLTTASLRLRAGITSATQPPRQIPLPDAGHCTFLVTSCGLNMSFLFALDALNGTLYCWLPTQGNWAEMNPAQDSAPYLGSEHLPYGTWRPELAEYKGASALLWPSDAGLFALRLSPLTLHFVVEPLSEGCCASPVLPLRGRHFVLQLRQGKTEMVSISLQDGQLEVHCRDIPDVQWVCSMATPQEAVWLSATGQVVANVGRRQYGFIPWQPGTIPQFDLGPAHFASDGRLWFQVLRSYENGHERCFIELGRPDPRKKPESKEACLSRRFLTGASFFCTEKQERKDPWEPEVHSSLDQDNDEVVMPLLESVADGSLLTLRVFHRDLGKDGDLLRSAGVLNIRYQIMGQHDDEVGFYKTAVRNSWITTAFLYDGGLYLYHPEFKNIYGWPLAQPVA